MIDNGRDDIPNDSDRELELALWLENADSGDIYILEILSKHFGSEIYSLFLALMDTGGNQEILHDRALILTEKVFQHAIQNIESFQGYESVRNWLITIAVNIFNSNQSSKSPLPKIDQKFTQGIATEQTLVKLAGQEETILDIYNKTNKHSRIAIILRFAHHLPVNRIAQILKMRIPEIMNTLRIFRSRVEENQAKAEFISPQKEKAHQKFLPLIELSLDSLLSDDPVGSKQLSQHLFTCTSCRTHHEHLSRLDVSISRAFKNRWPEEIFSAAYLEIMLKNFKNHPPKKKRSISGRNINKETLFWGSLFIVVLVFGYFLTEMELLKANPLIYPTLTIMPTSLITPKTSPAEDADDANLVVPNPTILVNSEPLNVISGYSDSTPINRKYIYYREPTLSANGEFLVFSASFTNITSDGPKFENGLYILNLVKDQIEPPIVFQDNSITDIWSFTPSISSNGRYIAFQDIDQDLHPEELNECIRHADPFSCSDVFIYDSETGEVQQAVNDSGVKPSRISRILPTFSGDGNWISYWSANDSDEAGNLSRCGENDELLGCWDINLLDLKTGNKILIPIGRSISRYRNDGFERLSLSENGNLLAFTLHIDDYLAPSLKIKNQKEAVIFERDLEEYQVLNFSDSGYPGNGISTNPVLSLNGQYAAFASTSDNLIPGDTNQKMDIFVRNIEGRTTTRVNISSEGAEANDESGVYFHTNEPWKDLISISSDGRYVVFLSSSNNIDLRNSANCPENSWFPCTNIYIHDQESALTEMISTETQRRDRIFIHPSLSANGERVAYVMSDLDCFQAPLCTHILLYDNNNKNTRNLTDFGFNTIRTHSDGTNLMVFTDEAMSGVTDLEFSPDNSMLASASSDKTVRIWNASGITLDQFHNEHNQIISDISFSPDGSSLASSSHDGTILIWDLETDEIKKLNNNLGPVFALDYSPDGKKLAAGGSNLSWIWDLEQEPPVIVKTTEYPSTRINSLEYSPDGKIIALGASDNTIWILSAETGNSIARLGGHEGDILKVSFSSDGRYLASGSSDSTVRIWELSEHQDTMKGFDALISIQLQDWINDLAFSPDNRHLAISSFGSEISLWELKSGEKINFPIGRRWFQPLSIDFSPQTSRIKLAIGSSRGGIELWSMPVIR